MRTSLKFVLALVATFAVAVPAQAQITDNIDATATVLQALTVDGDVSLAFGNIAPSQVKTVGAAAGGHFSINGAPSSSVSFRFNALPANLQVAGLSLSAWTGCQVSTRCL